MTRGIACGSTPTSLNRVLSSGCCQERAPQDHRALGTLHAEIVRTLAKPSIRKAAKVYGRVKVSPGLLDLPGTMDDYVTHVRTDDRAFARVGFMLSKAHLS